MWGTYVQPRILCAAGSQRCGATVDQLCHSCEQMRQPDPEGRSSQMNGLHTLMFSACVKRQVPNHALFYSIVHHFHLLGWRMQCTRKQKAESRKKRGPSVAVSNSKKSCITGLIPDESKEYSFISSNFFRESPQHRGPVVVTAPLINSVDWPCYY